MQNGVLGMIGETAVVTRVISGSHHPGRIRCRGEEWIAIPLDPDETLSVGTTVVIAAVEGGSLVVYGIS